MAKKNKKKSVLKIDPSPVSSPNSQPGTLPFGLSHSLLSPEQSARWFSAFGYAMTAALFLVLIAYFVKGYAVRPRILDREFVSRLLDPPSDIPIEIHRIGSDDSGIKAQSEEGDEGILFQVGPGSISGFILSRNLLQIPDDAQNFGLTILNAYQGIPSLNYGFFRHPPDGNLIEAFQNSVAVSTEMPPSEDRMRFFISMAASFYTPDRFSVPWDEANYFFFFYSSPVPTKIFLDNLIFIEKP